MSESLKSFTGKQVVLYFYPKDDTPGCTKEACDFRDAMASLLKTGAEKNLYSKKPWGIERSTFVLDRAGVMKRMFRNVKVDAHVADVLAVLKKS